MKYINMLHRYRQIEYVCRVSVCEERRDRNGSYLQVHVSGMHLIACLWSVDVVDGLAHLRQRTSGLFQRILTAHNT